MDGPVVCLSRACLSFEDALIKDRRTLFDDDSFVAERALFDVRLCFWVAVVTVLFEAGSKLQ